MKLTITEYSLTASAQLDYNIQKERTLHLVYCEGTSLAELVWPFNRLNIDGPLHIANQTVVLFETLQALSATVLWAPWYSSITQDRASRFPDARKNRASPRATSQEKRSAYSKVPGSTKLRWQPWRVLCSHTRDHFICSVFRHWTLF